MRLIYSTLLLCVLMPVMGAAQTLPAIWARGSCTSTDSMFLGGSSTQTALVGNKGAGPLTIESISIAGPNASGFSIFAIANKKTSASYTLPFTLRPTDTAVITLTFRPQVIGTSMATLSIVGKDSLGRHAHDGGGNYPYDTTVSICNIGFASGIMATSAHIEQYVTLTKVDTFTIRNTGMGPIQVTDITSTSTDFVNGYLSFTTSAPFPMNIPPAGEVSVAVTFNPRDRGICRRNFVADFIIQNSTGVPITTQVTARGHEIDLHSSIARNYRVRMGSDVPVQIMVDNFVDTLGKADLSGFIMEMVHYRRTVVGNDAAFNTTGQGSVGTVTEGASIAENMIEDSLHDPSHIIGEQGYYEMNVAQIPNRIGSVSTPFDLVNLRFHGIKSVDTSELVYVLKNFVERSTFAIAEYVNITTSPGLITVDTGSTGVKEDAGNIPLSMQCFPNPVSGTSSLQFSLPSAEAVTIVLHDALGRVVSVPVDHSIMNAGFHAKALQTNTLAAGTYFCTLQQGMRFTTQRLVKVP